VAHGASIARSCTYVLHICLAHLSHTGVQLAVPTGPTRLGSDGEEEAHMSGISKIILGVGLGVVTLAAGLAAVGTWRTTHVLTVSRTTTASPQAIWDLWADVANRTRWDEGLEWARIDGPFQPGARGEA